jgi:hypothetical protein
MMYRLCLRGPTGRIAKVRRYWASTDQGAVARARQMLGQDPTLIGFDLRDGPRQVAQERRRVGITRAGRSRAPSSHRSRSAPSRRKPRSASGSADR